jgi:Na+/H+-dicarboxylate symporter
MSFDDVVNLCLYLAVWASFIWHLFFTEKRGLDAWGQFAWSVLGLFVTAVIIKTGVLGGDAPWIFWHEP